MKRGSSLRFMEWPMPQTSAEVRRGCMAPPLLSRVGAQLLGRVLDGFDDVDIAGAAAEIAGDRLADLRLARIGVLLQEGVAGQHHAGRAVAALEAMLLPEAFLDRMELAVLGEPFDGHHLAAV